ncbi:hypothetical protein [Tautonia sociabilis]|uniref:hypothetical protein n=1 Tax=Tautonia sociabilis TaxID=2080755 RepID=UPI001315A340|nr:hypothetical protein [Tautonia sociabilis]
MAPTVARRLAKAGLPRGPRRSLWKARLEAVAFSWRNVMLVRLGALIPWIVTMILGGLF